MVLYFTTMKIIIMSQLYLSSGV